MIDEQSIKHLAKTENLAIQSVETITRIGNI